MRQLPIFIISLALAAGAGQACGGGERAHGGPEATADATQPQAGSASAERQIVTLTGCLKRDVQPGTFALVSVGSAGVLDTGSGDEGQAQNERQGAEAGATTGASSGTLAAGTSYRLIATDADHGQAMAQYENQRVAVRGRLAADVPVATTGTAAGDAGQAPPEGTVVESSETSAKVQGSAPPLRGFHVESVRKVADSCSAE